jgi:transposase-like protein
VPLIGRAGFRLSPKRDVAAAKAFFRKAIKSQQRCPQTITLDGYRASHHAMRELKADGSLPASTKVRSSQYLNNLMDQDHRGNARAESGPRSSTPTQASSAVMTSLR